MSELERLKLNPPLVVGEELAKVIKANYGAGSVIKIKPDNRYKDGNIKKVKGTFRGNSKTVAITKLEQL